MIYHTFCSVQNTANHPQANTKTAQPATGRHIGPTLSTLNRRKARQKNNENGKQTGLKDKEKSNTAKRKCVYS